MSDTALSDSKWKNKAERINGEKAENADKDYRGTITIIYCRINRRGAAWITALKWI